MTPCVLLPRDVDESMCAHAHAHHPNEACGLLFGERRENNFCITRALPCENVADHAHRAHFFLIDPRDVFEAIRSFPRSGEQLLGFFHSHPTAEAVPSTADLDFIRVWTGTVWLIHSMVGGTPSAPRAWWLDSPHRDSADELLLRIVPAAPLQWAGGPVAR